MSKKSDILLEYFYNRSTYLEHDVLQLQENIRFRPLSDVDCMELIIAKARRDMFLEVSKDVRHILQLDQASKIRNKR